MDALAVVALVETEAKSGCVLEGLAVHSMQEMDPRCEVNAHYIISVPVQKGKFSCWVTTERNLKHVGRNTRLYCTQPRTERLPELFQVLRRTKSPLHFPWSTRKQSSLRPLAQRPFILVDGVLSK